MKKISLILFLFLTLALKTNAQSANDTVLTLPPLFDYPVLASDSLSWTDRNNWLIEHFWDNFDEKQKSLMQTQVNHAMLTYAVPMRFADKVVVIKSIEKLIKRISKNPTLLIQFANAAERTMYDPQTADVFADEIYVKFLDPLIKNKKVPELRKVRFRRQLETLNNSMPGNPIAPFTYTVPSGRQQKYISQCVPTIIEFGDYDCTDCRMTRLRLETDYALQDLVKDGKAAILFITPDLDEEQADEWKNKVKDYPPHWTVGYSQGLDDILDLRISPCLYIIGPDGRLIAKNATVEQASNFVKQMADNQH